MSQPPLEIVTNRTPDSTRRLASRQLCEKALALNSPATSFDSWLMSNALRDRGELMIA